MYTDSVKTTTTLLLFITCLVHQSYSRFVNQSTTDSYPHCPPSNQSNTNGISEEVLCIFAIDCFISKGRHVGVCMDELFVKSCCAVQTLQDGGVVGKKDERESDTSPGVKSALQELSSSLKNLTIQEILVSLFSDVAEKTEFYPNSDQLAILNNSHLPDSVISEVISEVDSILRLEKLSESEPVAKPLDGASSLELKFLFNENITTNDLFQNSVTSVDDSGTTASALGIYSLVVNLFHDVKPKTESSVLSLEDFGLFQPGKISDDFETSLVHSDGFRHASVEEVCGRRFYRSIARGGRVVGGSETEFAKWPWQASLRLRRNGIFYHFCGATLLNNQWVITAAHCTQNKVPTDLRIRLGEYDVSDEQEPIAHVEMTIDEIYTHPNYSERTYYNDIALLHLSEKVEFDRHIIPTCLPEQDNSLNDRGTAVVTGWGQLYANGPYPNKLHEVEVPLLSNKECEQMFQKSIRVSWIISENIMCAASLAGGKDSCEGDSGGPMVSQRSDGRWELIGIISWGVDCAQPGMPGVYTRVVSYLQWMHSIFRR